MFSQYFTILSAINRKIVLIMKKTLLHPLFCLFIKSVERLRCILKRNSSQGRSEGTSSVAFEVLIINCHIEFMNCLTSNFCFPKNLSFASRRERLFIHERASLVLDFKLTQKYDDPLSSRHKQCRFPTKGIKLTRFVLFEVLAVSLWNAVITFFTKYKTYLFYITILSFYIIFSCKKRLSSKEIKLPVILSYSLFKR